MEEQQKNELKREIRGNNWNRVNSILKRECSTLPPEKHRNCFSEALQWACFLGKDGIVKELLELGADPNYEDSCGTQAIHYAIREGHWEVIMTMLKYGLSYSNLIVNGSPLLHWAAEMDHETLVEELVKNYHVPPMSKDGSGLNMLHVSSLHGSTNVLKYILTEKIIPVDAVDDEGWTALQYTCTDSKGDFCLVLQELLYFGANPRKQTFGGKTSLHLAYESGRINTLLSLMTTHQTLNLLTVVDDVTLQGENAILHPGSMFKTTSSTKKKTQLDESPSNDSWWKDSPEEHQRIIFLVWKRIILKEDTSMLHLYAMTQEAWRNPKTSTGTSENISTFLSAQMFYVGLVEMRELFFSCQENGLGLYSYIETEYGAYIESMQFLQLLKKLTQLRDFQPLIINQCILLNTPERSVIFLSLLCGRLRLVESLLRMCQFDLIPMTLLVICILRHLARGKTRLPEQVKQTLLDFADGVENMAVDALCQIFLSDNSQQKWVSRHWINWPLQAFGDLSLLSLAHHGRCTTFLSVSCCQTVLDHAWHGSLFYLPHFIRWILKVCPLVIWLPQVSAYVQASNPSQKEDEPLVSHYPGHRRSTRLDSIEPLTLKDQTPSLQRIRFIVHYFQSPSVKFFYHSIFHLLFLGFFIHVLMSPLRSSPNVFECLCIAFVLGYLLEEISQMIRSYLTYHSGSVYFFNIWNLLDLVAVSFTITGFILRMIFSQETVNLSNLYSGRVIYTIGFLFFSARVLHMFYNFRSMGPKLKMISGMLKRAVLPMLPIFFIFICCFGVILQGLLYPNGYTDQNQRNSRSQTFGSAFKLAFYGMWSVDVSGASSICWKNENGQLGCYLLFYCFYIIYAVIMSIALLNLLIALFADEVDKVNESSLAHWHAERYVMVEEYKSRSLLPPPFNCLTILISLMRFTYKVCRSTFQRHSSMTSNHSTDNTDALFIKLLVIQAFVLTGKRSQLGSRHSYTTTTSDSRQFRFLVTLKEEVHKLKRQTGSIEKWIKMNFESLQGDGSTIQTSDRSVSEGGTNSQMTTRSGQHMGHNQLRISTLNPLAPVIRKISQR